MDWKKTLNRSMWTLHGFFFVMVATGLAISLYALRLNNLQSDYESRTTKVQEIVTKIQSQENFARISKSLMKGKAEKAYDEYSELSKSIAELEEILSVKVSKDLGLALRTFKKLINQNSSFSDSDEALKVLRSKISTLETVAKTNNFKTILATAELMDRRANSINPSTAAGMAQLSYLESDLNKLERVVAGSSLTDAEKSGLGNRFAGMMTEIEMLKNIFQQSRDLKVHADQGVAAVGTWVQSLSGKVKDTSVIKEEKQQQLILMLVGFIGFIAIGWAMAAYLFRWQKQKVSMDLEEELKGLIKKGLMEDQRFLFENYSEGTQKELVTLMDQLKVKLSLGGLLHEGLPFAGFMVDKHFKVTWWNQLFCDQLFLSNEEVGSDTFNWDYIRDYLNITEGDPVYEALVHKIAGIYPVKIKSDELSPALPYEMYVSPITANREDRVMIFFYPLMSIKESIDQQVNELKKPLKQLIGSWSKDKLDDEEKAILEKDFKHIDEFELYSSLVQIYDKNKIDRTDLLNSILDLEKENVDSFQAIKGMKEVNDKRREELKKEMRLVNDMKTTLLETIEKSDQLMNINKVVLGQNDELKGQAQQIQMKTQGVLKKHKETAEIISQLDLIKNDYKKLKFELMEIKAKLVSMNNSFLSSMPVRDDQQSKLATRYKDELARLDFNVATLDKKLSQLDVLFSKLQVMYDRQEEQFNFNFMTSQKDHSLRESLSQLQKDFSYQEETIVDQFKSIFELLKNDSKGLQMMDDLASKQLQTNSFIESSSSLQ